MTTTPLVSVVLPTYNRAQALAHVLRTVLHQSVPPETYEIIVANNNSTDRTPDVIEAFVRQHPQRIRPLLVTQQGVAYARNAAIAVARATVVAFVDDDVEVAQNWIETILRTLERHDEVDCVGGKVLPKWSSAPPAWLGPEHWAPLALQDFGDEPFLIDGTIPRGLITANLACRRDLFARVGLFEPAYQRVGNGIGSLEDEQWMRRVWKAGRRALYSPEVVVSTEVPVERMTLDYHRRWHQGHGRFYALLRAEEFERSTRGHLFGVPAHLYRSAMLDAAAWLLCRLQGRRTAALTHEFRLRFFAGFVWQRLRDRQDGREHAQPPEWHPEGQKGKALSP